MKKMKYTLILLFEIMFLGLDINAQSRMSVRVPTDFVEEGKSVSLEMIVFMPDGDGPFPTVVFHHGSTGRGDNPALFSITTIYEPIAKFFNERGWLVAFPQRRGRGASDGLYDEGFTEDRSRYSISPEMSLRGLERALEDVNAVVAYLGSNPMVDRHRMIIGGHSRGGLLAIVYAGTHPHVFLGVINFVGGWIGDFFGSGIVRIFYDYMEKINTISFVRGAGFNKQTIWLYGENDSFYGLEHSKDNFNAFVTAGGKGTFHSYTLGNEKNDHYFLFNPNLWSADLGMFLDEIKM